MNIGIDARLLSEKITGISRFLINVLNYLPQYDNKNSYSLFAYNKTKFDNNFYEHHIVRNSKLPRQIREHLWLNITLPKLLDKNNIDLFFTPYILVPIKKSTQEYVIVIHDVMTKVCPQFFTTYYKKYMNVVVPQAIKRSDAIVTVSESAKNDIINYYNVEPQKIVVMHLWTDNKYEPLKLNHEQADQIIKKYRPPQKIYFVCWSYRRKKKYFRYFKNIGYLKI